MLGIRVVLLAISLTIFAFSTFAAEPQKASNFMLKNGMEVVVIPNTKMPVISQMVWYKIGAADEIPGKSGIAHFLEHLMFKGTDKYKTGEFSKRIAKIGGNDNAFTDNDYTAYYQNIPKAALENAMELEASRMQNLLFNENEVLKERDVILEERRMRIDSNPSVLLEEQMKAALYLNHPYHKPIIGWYHEMQGLNIDDARNWHKDYYNPANAILVVSGDITAEELKPLAEKYYGKIKTGTKAVRNNFTIEPNALAARTLTLTDSKVRKEELFRYYLAPSMVYGKKEYAPAISLLSYILGGSETSMLYQDMVIKNKKAVEINSSYDDLHIGPSIFSISATPADGIKLPELESALEANINKILQNGVDEKDLARAKKSIIAAYIYAQEDLRTLAYAYGQAMALGIGMGYVENWEKNINVVTSQQIQEAAKEIFRPMNSVTGYLLPSAAISASYKQKTSANSVKAKNAKPQQ